MLTFVRQGQSRTASDIRALCSVPCFRLPFVGSPIKDLPTGGSFERIVEARPEPRQREIEECAQFRGHEAIRRVYEADWNRRRLEFLQQRYEFARSNRCGKVIRKGDRDADPCSGGVGGGLHVAYDETRSHGDDIMGPIPIKPPRI